TIASIVPKPAPDARERAQSAESAYSRLPSVEAVLASSAELGGFSHRSAVAAVRDAIAYERERIRGLAAGDRASAAAAQPEDFSGRSGGDIGTDPPAEKTPQISASNVARIAAYALELLRFRARPRARRVINATGIVLHTNLGRARLADAAVDAVRRAASGESNLEYDLERGERGERDALVEEHLCDLTGAEAATVVNNNAAAVFLVLHTLAAGREVIVSRGELVEIG